MRPRFTIRRKRREKGAVFGQKTACERRLGTGRHLCRRWRKKAAYALKTIPDTTEGRFIMSVFRIEKTQDYTVMSNHHLRDKDLTLKAKGLLSQMLSLPDEWDYTLAGLSHINRERRDAIRAAIHELEAAGYITRSRARNEKGQLVGADYVIYEVPQDASEPSGAAQEDAA
jgi:hypothetical protein